jgi:predicted nucleic acid-binding protein
MKSVYLETTIPSYATAKASRDIIKSARQAITMLFWENARQNYDLYISVYVLDECAKGDSEAAQKRLDFIKGIKILSATDKTEELAAIYQSVLHIPDKAKIDSFHLAICVEAEIDYLLSWNFNHLGIASYTKLLAYNQTHGLFTPLLITPEMLNTEVDI